MNETVQNDMWSMNKIDHHPPGEWQHKEIEGQSEAEKICACRK